MVMEKMLLGGGATLSCNYDKFNGETVAVDFGYFSLLTMKGDFTLSYDLYRRGLLGTWCTDFGFGATPRWGVYDLNLPYGDCFIFVYYYYSAEGQNLGIAFSKSGAPDAPDIDLGLKQSETIGIWLHYEIHRKGKEFTVFVYNSNGKNSVVNFTSTEIFPVSDVHFFNAGNYQTGGGYYKNIKLYDSYVAESIIGYNNLYKKDNHVFGYQGGN